MNQQNNMAATVAANLVEGIATKLHGEAGAGITDLIALSNLVGTGPVRKLSEAVGGSYASPHRRRAQHVGGRSDPDRIHGRLQRCLHPPRVGGSACATRTGIGSRALAHSALNRRWAVACCVSADAYARRELAIFGTNTRSQFRDARALIDNGKAAGIA
jgi:hypothetical protein